MVRIKGKGVCQGVTVDSIALESLGFNGIIKSAVSPFSKSRDGTGTGTGSISG